MAEATHEILGGKVQLFRRPNSLIWHCRASVGGQQHRKSTREESLNRAKDVAEDWFLTLRGKAQRGEALAGLLFKNAANRFMEEYEVATQGHRNPEYVGQHRSRLDNYLIPFFGKYPLQAITPGLVQDYRHHRMTSRLARVYGGKMKADPVKGKAPSRSTMHQEIVVLRLVLKWANRHGHIAYVPNLAKPYSESHKVSHRAWFSPAEYKRLYEATRERAKNPPHIGYRESCEALHDLVLFMANTGLRPDEAKRLEYRDVEIITDDATGERILQIEVRQGKRGSGFCKSMPGAVQPFRRAKERSNGKPNEKVFPKYQNTLFRTVLTELDLRHDRDGQVRTLYSLRHTYISMRLLEGADIYQVAKNCRTSVEMIEKHYASHISNMINAAAINVKRTKPARRKAAVTA